MKTVLALLASSVAVAYGQLRAAPGPLCWYPSHICAFGASDGVIKQQNVDNSKTKDEQALDCHDLCDPADGCTDFTLFISSRMSTCYLLSSCTVDSEAVCIEKGTCFSGPEDCNDVNDNKPCDAIDVANTAAGNIHWQCTDEDGKYFNGYTASDIKAGSTCMLR